MRTPISAIICVLFISGCTSTGDRPLETNASTEPVPNVVTYDVAPANALPLGPVKAQVCEGGRENAMRRIFSEANRLGGNGITQLACSDRGLELFCWSSFSCEAIALNVPPPPPPPPAPALKPKRVKHAPPKKPPQPQSQLRQQQSEQQQQAWPTQPWPQQQQQPKPN